MLHVLIHLQVFDAADHLVDRTEAQLGHDGPHVFGQEAEEVDDVLGVAIEALAQLGVLGGDADRAGVQVALAHHDATLDDEGGGGHAVFLGSQQGGDDEITPGADLSVRL